MLQIIPNLHFSGQCKQALELYKKAFNARVDILLCESDANPADFFASDSTRDLVYHCEMYIGGQRITLNDSHDSNAAQLSHSMSLIITFASAGEVKAAYSLLSDGCKIIHHIQSTSYSSCFVSLIDRFGMRWELMTEQTEI